MLTFKEKKELEKRKDELSVKYFDLQDEINFARELAFLCRASDNYSSLAFRAENYEYQIERLKSAGICTPKEENILRDFNDELLLSSVEFYSSFVDFVEKYKSLFFKVSGLSE